VTTIAKADELATLRASLDVERAQNKTLHAELAALRSILASAAMLLEQAAAAFTLAGGHDVAVEKLECVAAVARQRLAFPLQGSATPDDVHNSHVDALRAVLGEAAERIGRQWEREAPTQPERPPVAPPTEDDEIGRALAEQCTCGGIAGGRACASTCAIFKESHPVCGAEPKQDGSDGPDFRPCTLPRGHEGPHSRNRLMPLHGRPIARREGPRKP